METTTIIKVYNLTVVTKKIYSFVCCLFLLAGVTFTDISWAATYQVDLDRSVVSFKIRNLGIWVEGNFSEYEGTIEYEPEDPQSLSASGSIQAGSIDTGIQKRDKHLLTKDFFHISQFPLITFTSAKVEMHSDSEVTLHGLLTIHGIKKNVAIDVDAHGISKDAEGDVTAHFIATTSVNRKDFGLTWKPPWDLFGTVMGTEVKIYLDIYANSVD